MRVFATLRPRSIAPSIEVRYAPFANANSFIQLKHGELEARISDALERAPDEILESLAFILLSKLYRRPVPKEHAQRYRRYLLRKPVRTLLANLKQQRGRKELLPPEGEHYNLIELFEDLNLQYFHGLMSRPDLGWSRRVSRQTLGHYDPSHHTIVLNKILDAASVPPLAVQFVLYHEMLHIKHPAEARGARRAVHTKAFRESERQFQGYAEARELLKRL